MNGILIAGAIVAVGLLIYLLVALPGDTGQRSLSLFAQLDQQRLDVGHDSLRMQEC